MHEQKETLRDRLLAMADYMASDDPMIESGDPLWPDVIGLLREAAARVPQSPVLAFQHWLARYVMDRGHPLTQDEYALAQAAFISAHPGDGPHSSFMAAARPPAGTEKRQQRIRRQCLCGHADSSHGNIGNCRFCGCFEFQWEEALASSAVPPEPQPPHADLLAFVDAWIEKSTEAGRLFANLKGAPLAYNRQAGMFAAVRRALASTADASINQKARSDVQ